MILVTQTMIGIILTSIFVAISIAIITNYINVALAQTDNTNSISNPNIYKTSPTPTPTPGPSISKTSPVPARNVTVPARNVTIVGPSNVTASPVTAEIQGNLTSTSVPSSTGTFLGTPGR